MEHIVFFTSADGAAQHRRTPSLEEAVRFVEHLRNVEGVDDTRVYAMTEVPLAFKTVYRVEIPGHVPDAAPAPLPPMPPLPADLDVPVAEAPAAVEAPVVAPEPVAEPVMEPVLAAAVPSEPYDAQQPEAPSNGKPAARGMGFFSR